VHALPALKHVEYDASSYAALEKEVLEEVGLGVLVCDAVAEPVAEFDAVAGAVGAEDAVPDGVTDDESDADDEVHFEDGALSPATSLEY
jgi:8-oxo-dGTP pyrophosphatase MutT (NUDIX family)